MNGLQRVPTTAWHTFPRENETRPSTTGAEKSADPRTDQTNARAKLPWRSYDERKVDFDEIDLSREGVRRFHECQGKNGASQFLQL